MAVLLKMEGWGPYRASSQPDSLLLFREQASDMIPRNSDLCSHEPAEYIRVPRGIQYHKQLRQSKAERKGMERREIKSSASYTYLRQWISESNLKRRARE